MHANWLEAFAFTRVSVLPEGTKTPGREPSTILDKERARQIYGVGSFGGPCRANDEVMHEIFVTALDDIVQLLRFE